MHNGGHAWWWGHALQGVRMPGGGLCGRGAVWQEACMTEGCEWQWGVEGWLRACRRDGH